MGKERLKDIAYNVGISADGEKALMSSDDYDFLYNYAKEQAERVEELEEDLLELVKQNKELRKSIAFYSSESYNAHLERLLDRSEQQNKRYKQALERILENWKTSNGAISGETIAFNSKEIARKALEGDK